MSPFVVPRDRLDELMNQHNVSLFLGRDNILGPLEVVVVVIYAILFLSGLTSNVWVLTVFGTVARNSGSGYTNALFYTVSLTCVDLLVLLSVPATIADLAVGQWLLPDALCPLYWTLEMLNKIGSSLMVAFIAIACYFSVCRPHMKSMYKSTIVAGMHMMAAVIYLSWKSYNVWRDSEVFYIVDIDENETLDVLGKKCLFESPDIRDRATFTVSAFVSGYVLPVFVMVICYAAILRRVYSQSRLLSRRGMHQFQNVAKSASILVIFYLLTWTPYWLMTALLSVLSEYGPVHESIARVAVFSHMLPLANCAFSPLIYTLLNRHMREQYRTAVARTQQLAREVRTMATAV